LHFPALELLPVKRPELSRWLARDIPEPPLLVAVLPANRPEASRN
jgi:hypothetical protein